MLPEHARYLLRHNPLRRDPRSRTGFLLNPNQADYRLPRSRGWWRWPESNPLRQRLQGAPATSAVIPTAAAARNRGGVPAGTAGLPVVLTLWTSQFAITFPPKGGDPQGRRDSNSRQAVLEAAVLPLNYVPIEMETAPRGLPWGGCRRMPSMALHGNRPGA